MRVTRRVPPDEVPRPDSHCRIDDQQFAVGRIGAYSGDATFRPRRDQRPSRRRVAVGTVRVKHHADGHTTLDRSKQGPSV
jgi:hypothetical protein